MSKRRIFICGILLGFVLTLLAPLDVFAADASEGDGGAVNPYDVGCDAFLRTNGCNGAGAKWEYESMEDIASGKIPGVTMNADGSVTIAGWSGNNGFRASGATITCPAGAGGIYRYSMVALKSLTTADGITYNAGDLVGLTGMDGNSNGMNLSSPDGTMNGGMAYAGDVGSYNSARDAYNELYNNGSVHLGWGTGSGLSWFCSNGDGGYKVPEVSDPCDGSIEDGITTISTKVINPRLVGVGKGWKNYDPGKQVTYAMPTDELQWAHCYYPGVQKNWDKLGNTLGQTIINTSEIATVDPEGFHANHTKEFKDDYGREGEPFSKSDWGYDNTGYTTMKKAMDNNGLKWENWFKITRSNVFPWAPDSQDFFEFKNGIWQKYSRKEYSAVGVANVGSTLSEKSDTSEPTKFVLSSISDDGGWGCKNVKYQTRDKVGTRKEDCSWTINSGEWWPCYDGDVAHLGPYTCACSKDVDVYDWVEHTKELCNYHGGGYTKGELETYSKSSAASVIVPYNFNNIPNVVLEDGDSHVFAGGTIKVKSAEVAVMPKANYYTEAEYATIVRDATVKLIGYVANKSDAGYSSPGSNTEIDMCSYVEHVGDMCKEMNSYTGTLNGAGDLNGTVESIQTLSSMYNVYDASAGDYMCFRVGVFPASSDNLGDPYDDDNTSSSGNNRWAFSAPACKVIAKKPVFEVLGGSIYSSIRINTSSMGKVNLYHETNRDNYVPQARVGERYYGSFVEQSIYGLNSVIGLGSGNSYWGNIGINDNSMCSNHEYGESGTDGKFLVANMAPLTFANAGNKSCKDGTVGNMNEAVESVNRAELVDYWAKDSAIQSAIGTGSDGLGAYTILPSSTGKEILYSADDNYSSDTVSMEYTIVTSGVTRIVKTSKDIYINGNIVYGDMNAKMLSAGDIPQTIIYGKNIYINCEVQEIDAILITESKVNTCYNTSDNVNDARRSHPLTILGTVIANKMDLGRTYGASVGEWTGVPAETINYDSSILLWARYMAGAGESNVLTMTYQTELAPRY